MKDATTYVILGAGQLGLAIMDELAAAGKRVTLVNRSGKHEETLPEGVTLISADCSDPQQVATVCQDADIVFLCVQPAYTRWPEEFPPLVEAIIDGVAQTSAKLVFGSNMYLYGPTGGAALHEGLPAAAETRKGKARAQVASMLMAAHTAQRVPVVIGRASDFYGPRVTDSMAGDMLFEAALAGKSVNMVGDIDLPHTLTYIRDFARALITLSQHDEAFGQVWHVPSAPTVSTRDFLSLVEAEIGRKINVRTAGRTMLRLIGLFQPTVREVIEMLYEFEEPFIVDHSRFEAAFGGQVTPHQHAIAETVAWYKRQHAYN